MSAVDTTLASALRSVVMTLALLVVAGTYLTVADAVRSSA